MRILIAGYPYIREYYFKTFDYYPRKDSIFFLLPKTWKAKGGKVIFNPLDRKNVFKTKAFFYHSNYFLIGGVFKGLMPALPLYIRKVFKERNGILYSPSEPILLTTLYQGICAKIFGLKHVIFTWENIDYKNKFKGANGFIKNLILKLNLFFCDGIICGNKKSKEIFSRLTHKPIRIIPISGIDTDYFKPRTNTKTSYELGDKIVYTFAGALGYRKGVHLILAAFRKIVSKIPNAHLVIIGSGEDKQYEKELEKDIGRLGIKNHLTRTSWVGHEKLLDILSASDIFLYPSIAHKGWEEQFGYSIAEASLMRLPVISTTSGSIEEVVVNEATGILIRPDSVKDLEEAMIKLGEDESLRHNLGTRGREFIEERYSYSKIAEQFYSFFELIYG